MTPTCSTCNDTMVVRQESQVGAPGSGGLFACPDCSTGELLTEEER